MTTHSVRLGFLATCTLLAACGGGGGGGGGTPTTYTIGGSVSGLAGTGLVLQNNAGNNLAVAANGSFTFSTALANGAAYAVTVLAQPTNPSQTCSVTAGSGTVAAANVTATQISCTSGFSVGGTVTGLDASGLVLQNNGGPDLPIAANGAFTFPAAIESGAAYAVTVKTQPNVGPLQICSVTNGSGTIGVGAVATVAVVCATKFFKFLYVTSPASNAIHTYSIDAGTGSLAAVAGSPFAANGSPRFATGEASGQFLYVTNSGVNVIPTISGYSVNAATGRLTELATSPFDLSVASPPAMGAFVSPPAMHRSGAFGYVTVPVPNGQLFGGTVAPTTGELTEIPGTPFNIGADLTGLAFDLSGQLLFATTNASPGAGGRISTFQVNSPSGVLTPLGNFPTGGDSPIGVFLTPQEDFLLTTNRASGTVTVFAVGKSSGTPTGVLVAVTTPPVATGPTGAQPIGIALHRRNNVLYVTNIPGAVPGSIATFQLSATTGNLAPVGPPIPTNGASAPALLHPSGRFLLQYNSATQSVQRYSLDPATGAPTLVAPSFTPAEAGPHLLFVDPSGQYAYMLNQGAATLSSYTIDATTGAFTHVSTVPTGAAPAAFGPFHLQ